MSVPRDPARSKARAASRRGKRHAINSSTGINPCSSSGSAASNRPQREPTSVISLRRSGAVSIGTAVHRRFHNHRAARLAHRQPRAQAFGLPVASTTQRKPPTGQLPRDYLAGHPAVAAMRILSRVPAKQMHPGAVGLQNLRDQQSELAVAQHRHALALWESSPDPESRTQRPRLDEDGVLLGNRLRHAMQIALPAT